MKRTFVGCATKGDRYDVWSGKNAQGRLVSNGVYIYRIRAVNAAGNKSTVARGT